MKISRRCDDGNHQKRLQEPIILIQMCIQSKFLLSEGQIQTRAEHTTNGILASSYNVCVLHHTLTSHTNEC